MNKKKIAIVGGDSFIGTFNENKGLNTVTSEAPKEEPHPLEMEITNSRQKHLDGQSTYSAMLSGMKNGYTSFNKCKVRAGGNNRKQKSRKKKGRKTH
jgi:hypothetical protein